jgi:hypothetical protein
MRDVLHDAMDGIFLEGRQCVFIDEARYLCQRLRLEQDFVQLLQQGRSLKISVIATTQRPSAMPLEMYDQSTHLFLWRDTDRVNLRRLGEIGGQTETEPIRDAVLSLDAAEHEFLYVDTRSGRMVVSAL